MSGPERVLDEDALDHLTILEILGQETMGARDQSGLHDERVPPPERPPLMEA